MFSTLTPTVKAQTTSIPKVTLVKLWEVSHKAYMAKFVGEKYVVVFTGHGDVSLDGKYISSGGTAYVYKVDTGELLATLTPDTDDDNGDTWEVISWEPFQYVKRWDASGFFSADSKRMIEDVYMLGTNAKVVDTTSWTTIPIDWGFTDTTVGNFYAIQLDYSGATLFVGHIGDGTIYVYKYDSSQGKYVLAFSHQESGNYGRRVQITLDGKYIVVGGLDYPYLDIWEWSDEENTYIRVAHYQLPDTGGIRALGISDPYNVGYVVAGTKNGWVIVAYFDASTKEFNVIYEKKEAPDDSWIYNPFYERWIPKVTEVFALCSHRDSGRPGYGIVYDVLTNQTTVIHFADPGTPQWSAAAVSPEANYVFLGNALYMVVRRDMWAGQPRLRFIGSMRFSRGFGLQDLGSPIILESPKDRDWHMLFYSGKVTVRKLVTEAIPVDLTTDRDVLEGRIGNLYDKGLVKTWKVAEIGGYIQSINVTHYENPGKGITPDRGIAVKNKFVLLSPYGWNGHGFEGSTLASITEISIPLEQPVDVYSEIVLNQSISIVTVAPVFDPLGEFLGVFGIPLAPLPTALALGEDAAKLASEEASAWISGEVGTKVEIEVPLELVEEALVSGSRLTFAAKAALATVGAFLIIDAGVGIYSKYVTYSSCRSIVMNVPIVVDKYGNKYAVVHLILPEEEIPYLEEYFDHARNVLEKKGVPRGNVGLTYSAWGSTWEEYRDRLEKGYLPTINIREDIKRLIASAHGIPLEELRITEICVHVETLVHGFTNLWDFIAGGLRVIPVTIIAGHAIMPKAVVAGGQVITDPEEIARTLGSVKVNDVEYGFVAGAEGAYVDFHILLGADKLAIDFNRRGFFGDIDVELKVAVIKLFESMDEFGYVADLLYDYESTLIRISTVHILDIPYKAVKILWQVHIPEFKEPWDVTHLFYEANVSDPNSPSGYRFSYALTDPGKILLLDPANGGIMQPGKRYTVYYFYKQPPDTGLMLLFNGTKPTFTLPSHATVVINSTETQTVKFDIVFRVKAVYGLREETIIEDKLSGEVSVEANKTAYAAYDIVSYVGKAVEIEKWENTTAAYLEVEAWITEAEYNWDKSNDRDLITWWIPPAIAEEYGQPVKLRVEVFNAFNFTGIAGVDVWLSNNTVTLHNVTDANGVTYFNASKGLWYVEAYHPDYLNFTDTWYLWNDSEVRYIYMFPAGTQNPVTPPINGTQPPPIVYNETTYWWLSVEVIWKDGFPFQGALVTIYNATTNEIIYQLETNGTGFVHVLLPNSSHVTVQVNATHPETGANYSESREVIMDQHWWLVFTVPWESKYYAPEVWFKSLEIVIWRGQGWFFGNVSHLIVATFWTNKPQTITVKYVVYNWDTNETITSFTKDYSLEEGVNVFWEWFSINASQGMNVRAYGEIVSYENDTDLTNNAQWSNVVFLKPFVDLAVFVVWKPVEQKIAWALLPEDIIEVDIGISVNVNVTTTPANLLWSLMCHDVKRNVMKSIRDVREELRAYTGIVWRNVTITVPWTDKIEIHVKVEHPWEDMVLNNYANTTITIDPDVKIKLLRSPSYVREGSIFEITVELVSNVPKERNVYGSLSVTDETLGKLIKAQDVLIEPEKQIKFRVRAPENPAVFLIFKEPVVTHDMQLHFVGFDVYGNNNYQYFKINVLSSQIVGIIMAIAIAGILIVLIIVAARAVKGEIVPPEKRFKMVTREPETIKFKFIRREEEE